MDQPTSRARLTLHPLLLIALYTLLRVLLDVITRSFETAPEVALFYPSPALDFVLLLVFGLRYLPVILIPTLLDVWFIPPINIPPIPALIYALMTTLVYGGCSVFLVRWLRIDIRLSRLRDVLGFVFFATLVAPLILAILSISNLVIAGVISPVDWKVRILHFWVGDAIGIASLAPFLLVCVVPRVRSYLQFNQSFRFRPSWEITLERLAQAIAVVLGAWITFDFHIEDRLNFLYLCFIPMIWVTVRYGLPAATLAILVIVSEAAFLESLRYPTPELGIDLAGVQFCMLAVSQTALLLGATITRRFQAYAKLQEQAHQEHLLNQIGQALNSTLDPEQILQRIVDLIGEGFKVDRVVLWQLGTERVQALNEWRLGPQVSSMLRTSLPLSVWFGESDADSDTWQHEPFQAWNYDEMLHSIPRSALIQQAQILSILRVPIFIRDRFFGSLSLHTTTNHRRFTDNEVELLVAIAEQAAIALHNAQSYEQLERLVQARTQELEHEKLISETANRAKTEFLANMSHELRTPLTSVIGFSSVLREQVFGSLNDRQHQYITAIHTSGEHLLTLINDILDLARIESGKDDLQLAQIQVEEICQACLSLVSERAQIKGLALALTIAPETTTCLADGRRLKQILINLLANAIKFTDVGSVTLQVNRTEAEIAFSIIDTGIGIAETDLADLFQPFRQLNTGLNRKYEGTGLGLALSQRLAQLHGGEITVESKLGHGSRFTLHLPAQRTPPA